MKSKKKVLTGLTAVVLIVALAIGGTYAYLTAQTEEKNNKFTFVGDLTAALAEPEWDGLDEDGNQVDPDTDLEKDSTLGMNIAKEIVPGTVIPKDPTVHNTTEKVDEFVALQVTFQNGEKGEMTSEQLTRLLGLIEIDWSNSWTKYDGNPEVGVTNTYYYNDIVIAGDATAPLFTTVTVKDTITNDDLTFLRDTLKGFNIEIKGCAVQVTEGKTNVDDDVIASFTFK